jgi:hypothetical protein
VPGRPSTTGEGPASRGQSVAVWSRPRARMAGARRARLAAGRGGNRLDAAATSPSNRRLLTSQRSPRPSLHPKGRTAFLPGGLAVAAIAGSRQFGEGQAGYEAIHGQSITSRKRRVGRHVPLHELRFRARYVVDQVTAALSQLPGAVLLGIAVGRRQRARSVSGRQTAVSGS